MAKVPVSGATKAVWQRYCQAVGVGMGLQVLREVALDHGDVLLPCRYLLLPILEVGFSEKQCPITLLQLFLAILELQGPGF